MRSPKTPGVLLRNYRLLRAALHNPQANPQLHRQLEQVDRALETMKPEYRQLLRMLYIDPPNHRYWIMQELAISESTFYRRKRLAMRAFLVAMAGCY